MPQLIITDQNWQDHWRAARQRDQGQGFYRRQSPVGGLACATIYGEAVPLIPEAEWPERIAECHAKKAFVKYAWEKSGAKVKDQNGYGYCWAYSLTSCVEMLRVIEGQQYVDLAPESLGYSVGWRNRGNSLDTAITDCAQRGIAERRFVPLLNISGNYATGWKENALNFKPAEWFDLGGTNVWPQTVSALLRGFPVYVGLDWWSHAIMYGGLTIASNGEIVIDFLNSWGQSYGTNGWGQLAGSRKVPSMDSYVPRSITFYTPTTATIGATA